MVSFAAGIKGLVAAMAMNVLITLPRPLPNVAEIGAPHPISAVKSAFSERSVAAQRDDSAVMSKDSTTVPENVALASGVEVQLRQDASVSIKGTVFFGWSLLDRETGSTTGSTNRNSRTNSTESMIKVWITADYLRRLDAAGGQPTARTLHELTRMIINSDDNIAQKYYVVGGRNAVVARLISMCGLTGTTIYKNWWSKTRMTPADAVRYGECVTSGRAAGSRWTPWVLQTMTHVHGDINYQQRTTGGGRWGVIDALPPSTAATTSIKNGWTAYDGVWHVNCMAIQRNWILVVMMRYSPSKGLKFGAHVCASVTEQLMAPPLPMGVALAMIYLV